MMLTRILTGAFLIVASLVSLFLFPFPLFLVLVDTALLIGFLEMKKIMRGIGLEGLDISLPFLLGLPWIWNYIPEMVVPVMAAALVALLVGMVAKAPGDLKLCLPGTAVSLFTLIYLGLPLSILSSYQINSPLAIGHPSRIWELMLVFTALWLSDSGAYFIGRAMGRHKITPRISPNKSLEGFIAGLLFPACGAVVYGRFLLPEMPPWFLALTGMILGISGIFGDLFESALKRGSGIKDSSKLFPGHGGMLDRIDSILTGIPVFYLLMLVWEHLS